MASTLAAGAAAPREGLPENVVQLPMPRAVETVARLIQGEGPRPEEDLRDMRVPAPYAERFGEALSALGLKVAEEQLTHRYLRDYTSSVLAVRAEGGPAMYLPHVPAHILDDASHIQNVNALASIQYMFPEGSALTFLSFKFGDPAGWFLSMIDGWQSSVPGLPARFTRARFVSWRRIDELEPANFPPDDLGKALLIEATAAAGRGRTPAAGSAASQPGLRDSVFISYSHKDARWLERLKVHLKPLERSAGIRRWDDTRIEPGMVWREEIADAIRRARVAILLVSADFLASDFIASAELPPLLQAAEDEGATVLSIILSTSRYEKTEALSRFQSVNPPSRPLDQLPKAEQEKVFAKAADAVERAFTSGT